MGTESKILTVSIAAYNVEAYLTETLESLMSPDPQVMDAMEVLIVDDGSSDRTPEIAKSFVEKAPGTFRYIGKENGGWGSTVNTAMREGTGKYLRLLDGDDCLSTEDLPAYIAFLKQTESDLVITPFVSFVDGNPEERTLVSCELTDQLKDHPELTDPSQHPLSDLAETYDMKLHTASVRMGLLRDHLFTITEHSFYTDVEYMCKTLLHAQTYSCCALPMYRYRIGRSGQSMSIAGAVKHYAEHRALLDRVLAIYAEQSQPGTSSNPQAADQAGEAVAQEHLRTTRARLLERRLYVLLRTQYDFCWLQPASLANLKRLREFDAWAKTSYPDLYRDCASKKIRLSRSLKFLDYPLMRRLIIHKSKHEV